MQLRFSYIQLTLKQVLIQISSREAMEIRGLSALVTGASGFIGGRLAERLATEEGVRVRAMVRNAKRAERLRKLQLEIVKADLLDLSSLREAMDGCDLVFHCAALVRETGDRNEFFRINVKGTENILKVSSDTGVKKIHPLQQRGRVWNESTRQSRRNHALPALRESLLRHKDCCGEGRVGHSSGDNASSSSDSTRQCLWPAFQSLDSPSHPADKFGPDDADQRRDWHLQLRLYR